MKILLISSIPENLEDIAGGIESVTINLLQGFSNLDIQLKVISFRKEVKNFHIFKFAPNIKIYYYPYRFIKSNKIFFILYGSVKISNIVKSWTPDIIHLQGNGSSLLLLLRLKNKNIVITPHGYLKGEYLNIINIKKKINQIIAMFIEYLLINRFNNFIFISEYLKNIFYNQKGNDQIKSHAVIFNPVNPIFFSAKDNDVVNRLNILYIGVISKGKGLINLLNCLIDLKTRGIVYHLNIVGEFNSNVYKDLILATIKENNLDSQITFYGRISQKSIAELMDHNGIFVLPSYQESLPMSLIESMSSGKLVIATDVGGISEIVKNELTGYIYKINDKKQLSNILEKLYYNPKTYLNLSNNARIFAKDTFSPSIISKKTKCYYSAIISA